MDKYILYWLNTRHGWCYGGTYATRKLAIDNAKKTLSGWFDYRLEMNGRIVEQGTARGERS